MGVLWLDFAGATIAIEGQLSFGRHADLVLDEANGFMHRVIGELRDVEGTWWLYNRGTSTRLLVFGGNGTRIELPPGTECVLPMAHGSISFLAGLTPYQLLYQSDAAPRPQLSNTATGEATMEFGTVLSKREALYLTTFALNRLRGTTNALLTYSEVAALWVVSEKTIDNTLQRVRSRLKAAGVRDTETLEGLVNHLLAHGRIGLSTLVEIEAAHPDVLPPG